MRVSGRLANYAMTVGQEPNYADTQRRVADVVGEHIFVLITSYPPVPAHGTSRPLLRCDVSGRRARG